MVNKNKIKITATGDEVLFALRRFVNQKGSQAAAAKELGFTKSYLCYIVNGKRPITTEVAEKLGYQRVDLYEKSPWKEKEEM